MAPGTSPAAGPIAFTSTRASAYPGESAHQAPITTKTPMPRGATMATAGRPPSRKVAADPIGRRGRESLVALLLVAAIVFLFTDSVPIGVAVLVLGTLVVAGVAIRHSG